MQAPLQARNDYDAAQTDTIRTVAQKRGLADNRPEAVAQRKMAEMMNNSPRVLQQRALSDAIHNSARMVAQRHEMNALFGGAVKRQGDGAIPAEAPPAQRDEKTNQTGLPKQLKSGIESLSGMSMDHVKVHYNSAKPAQLQAHAYAQGSEIHLGAGQEKHLPHEAWHVVQQGQGRVQPPRQMKGGVAVNDDAGLENEADVMGARALQMAASEPIRESSPASAGYQGLTVVQMYDPEQVLYKTEEALLAKGRELHLQRENLLDQGDVSGVFSIAGDVEELLDIARSNGWFDAFQTIAGWGEYVASSRDEKREQKLIKQALALAKRLESLSSEDTQGREDIFEDLQWLEREAGKKGWNHVVRLVRRAGVLPEYQLLIFSNPSGQSTYATEPAVLNDAILKNIPDPQLVMKYLKNLDNLLGQIGVKEKEDAGQELEGIKKVILANLNGEEEAQIKIVKAFVNTYRVGETKKLPATKIFHMLNGVVTQGLKRRTESPLITVGGPSLAPQKPLRVVMGMHMTEVETQYDIIARKSSAPGGGMIPGAVHEVDLAFLDGMRGIPTVRASLQPEGQIELGSDDGGGEKVYALGHTAALNFAGGLSNVGLERFYGVMYPKGFLSRYGVDLRAAGVNGKSASTPVDADFARGYMHDNKNPDNPQIRLPEDKAFAIRAEDATPEGQAHIHFGRTNMNIHGKKTSQLDFFRMNAVGAVEYNLQGVVLNIKYF